MTNCIEIKGLVKEYKSFTLGPIDLTVPGGSILGLIGENGAGKSTLIKSMLGIAKPSGGSVTLLGTDPDHAKEDIGVVMDDCFFSEYLRVKDVNSVLSRVYRDWDKALFQSYLDKFSVAGAKSIKELSRGMRMKLSLAAALARRPKILDEFLEFISDDDHAILISSHITSDLEKVADYIAYLHQGKLLMCDEKDRLLESYGRLVCAKADLGQIDRGYIVATRKSQYSTEALIRHKSEFKRLYPRLTVEPVTLDELMVFIVKGERA